MRIAALCLILNVLLVSPLYAADGRVKQAMELFRKSHFESAAGLRAELQSMSPQEAGSAYLSLGVIYLSSAELYSRLHDTAVAAQLDYLKRLNSAKGRYRSRLAKLYMAEALLEAGRPGDAASYLKGIINDGQVKASTRNIARAQLGLAYYLSGSKAMAESMWGALGGTSDPDVLSELAAAYGRAGMKQKESAALCDKALALSQRGGGTPSLRVLGNSIYIYTRVNRVDEALGLFENADKKRFSDKETLGENKSLRFYSPSFLGRVSRLFEMASIAYLKKGSAVAGSAALSQYYLGRAYARAGMVEEAAQSTDFFLTSVSAPKIYQNSARVRQVENLYRGGRREDAMNQMEGLSREFQGDPVALAEIVTACVNLGTDCPGIVPQAARAARAGEGRKFSPLNHSLGRYYLMKGDHERAVLYMEAGRDKSNKNKIEFNAPLLLADVAEAYYRIKKFSEALEIYFEMSRQFPAVRQLQDVMQGVYSMEQKSAGDVKVL
jgi:tetratricopeptide (TPR) repeat protein